MFLPRYNSATGFVGGVLQASIPMASLRARFRAGIVFVLIRHLRRRTRSIASYVDGWSRQDGRQRGRLKASSSSSSSPTGRNEFVVLQELRLVQRRLLRKENWDQVDMRLAVVRRLARRCGAQWRRRDRGCRGENRVKSWNDRTRR